MELNDDIFWSFICATAKIAMAFSSLKLMYLLAIGLLSLGLVGRKHRNQISVEAEVM